MMGSKVMWGQPEVKLLRNALLPTATKAGLCRFRADDATIATGALVLTIYELEGRIYLRGERLDCLANEMDNSSFTEWIYFNLKFTQI